MNDPSAIFGLLFAGFWIIWLVLMLLGILGFVLWIVMLIDCIKRDFPKENEKILWILIIALTSYIGAIIYYFLIYRKKSLQKRSSNNK
ncbi:MAG: hypothetical protein CVU81_00920 [Euryarchaeota archaeon HGW-Euryarchaeota-1]|nr:MAG: hypothetical protein CVU81_00920 [Euryarchaeota archaeon HGW-Euryarchaeota-1]